MKDHQEKIARRQKRLAQNLRTNLLRRKTQMRQRQEGVQRRQDAPMLIVAEKDLSFTPEHQCQFDEENQEYLGKSSFRG